MRLYDQPCTEIRMGRRRYKLRLTYTRVLFALEALKDPLLTDEDRLRLMLGLMIRGRIPTKPEKQAVLLQAITEQIGQKNKSHEGPPTMSLTQDDPLIRAAFQQAYGIDIHAVDLPWTTFCELLSGLPENTRFCEVVALRARPIPLPDKNNSRYREELLKAKAAVALDLTDEERQASYQAGLDRFARTLIAWAEHASKDGDSP